MEDLRVQRTYLLLKNALLELLAKKSFDEIKVNDICNLAMIHRTTFYSHFQDKYDLLEYCVKNIEQELTEKLILLNILIQRILYKFGYESFRIYF